MLIYCILCIVIKSLRGRVEHQEVNGIENYQIGATTKKLDQMEEKNAKITKLLLDRRQAA